MGCRGSSSRQRGRISQEIRHRVAPLNWRDEPLDAGGADSGPSPYDLLVAGARRLHFHDDRNVCPAQTWPLESVTVRLRHSRIHAEIAPNAKPRKECSIALSGTLN